MVLELKLHSEHEASVKPQVDSNLSTLFSDGSDETVLKNEISRMVIESQCRSKVINTDRGNKVDRRRRIVILRVLPGHETAYFRKILRDMTREYLLFIV